MLVLGKKRKSLHRLFFDDSIFSTHPAVRNHRQFTFNEKGKYIDKANRERAKAKLEKLQAEISRIAKTTGIAVENKAAIIQPKKFFVCTLFFIYRFDKLFFSRLVRNRCSQYRMVGLRHSSTGQVCLPFSFLSFIVFI